MRKMLTELSTDCYHDATLTQELEQAMFILPSEVRRKQGNKKTKNEVVALCIVYIKLVILTRTCSSHDLHLYVCILLFI